MLISAEDGNSVQDEMLISRICPTIVDGKGGSVALILCELCDFFRVGSARVGDELYMVIMSMKATV